MSTNSNEEYLLEVKDLHTSFFTESGEVKAVNGVSFTLKPGEVMGIVGESGSGKSVTAYSIMQILADTGRIVGGQVLYRGQDLGHSLTANRWLDLPRKMGRSIIFQDPMTSPESGYFLSAVRSWRRSACIRRKQRRRQKVR